MLTDRAIRGLKPKEKPYKVSDGLGLHLRFSQTARFCGGLSTASRVKNS